MALVGVDAQHFNWLDRPDDDLLNNAVQQLVWLGALERQNGQSTLTEFGRLVIDLQVGCSCFIKENFASIMHRLVHAACPAAETNCILKARGEHDGEGGAGDQRVMQTSVYPV